MKGYYKNPQATAETMDGDWYKTGDLGYYSEHGKQGFNRKHFENVRRGIYILKHGELIELII